jgi:hypothetical protein
MPLILPCKHAVVPYPARWRVRWRWGSPDRLGPVEHAYRMRGGRGMLGSGLLIGARACCEFTAFMSGHDH